MKQIANSTNIKIVFLSIIFSIFMGSSLSAQKLSGADSLKVSQFRHAINFCPVAIAFGFYSVNYEYMLKPSHGLVFRGDYEAITKAFSEGDIDPYGYSFILNYRYHLKPAMSSFFVGAYGRYRVYEGEGELEGSDFEFERPDFTIGLNAGKRWAWKSGFNITFALGYGYSWDDLEVTPNSPAAKDAVNKFLDDYDFASPFYGEFSIGYAF